MVAKKFWHSVASAALGALLVTGGCSSSSSGNGGGNGGEDAGTSTGGEGTPGNLDDKVAGKACESSDDCKGDGAECLTSFDVGGEFGAAVGLSQEAPGGYCSATCTDDSQCGEGGVCANNITAFGLEGQCEKACQKDGDCRDGYVCTSLTEEFEDIDPEDLGDGGANLLPEGGIPQEALTCRPAQETASLRDNVAGRGCIEDADCNGVGAECLDSIGGVFGFGGIETPGGYCSGDCSEDSDCGAGGVCVGAFSSVVAGSCLKACESNDDCERDGHLCREFAGTAICLPTPALEDGEAGTACEADTDCGENGTCAAEAAGSGETLEGGFCTLTGCLTDDECGAGGACQVSVDGNGVPSSTCAEACSVADQDCSRDNFVCVTQDDASAALGDVELSPYCQLQAKVACDPACDAGQVCDNGTCVAE